MTATVSVMEYGWGWHGYGEDVVPPEPGKRWIQIGPITDEGFLEEETAVIVCRDYERIKRERPEHIKRMEADAQKICDALNHMIDET